MDTTKMTTFAVRTIHSRGHMQYGELAQRQHTYALTRLTWDKHVYTANKANRWRTHRSQRVYCKDPGVAITSVTISPTRQVSTCSGLQMASSRIVARRMRRISFFSNRHAQLNARHFYSVTDGVAPIPTTRRGRLVSACFCRGQKLASHL